MNLKIALVCDTLEITESDFIRESISNEFLRLQSAPSSQERLIAWKWILPTQKHTSVLYLRTFTASKTQIHEDVKRMIATQPTTKEQLLNTLRKMKFNKFELINTITIRELKKMKHQLRDSDVVDVVIIKSQ